jgi:hypothetical protein
MLLFTMPLMLIVVAVAFLLVFRGRTPLDGVTGTDPLCGQCGYCVRGLLAHICPECGGNLREVGIITPGSRRPLSRGKRVLLWTIVAPMPVLLLFAILFPMIGPQWLRTTQRRVIFSQSSFCFVTITVNCEGKRLTFGTPRMGTPPVAPEVMFLYDNKSNFNVQVATNTFRTTDTMGKTTTGIFNATAIERWLNADGYTDPRVADSAKGVAAAIAEIGTPAGNSVSRFSAEPSLGGLDSVTAHPTFIFTRGEPNELTVVSWIVLAAITWLGGLPFVLRRKRSNSSNHVADTSTGSGSTPHSGQQPLPAGKS